MKRFLTLALVGIVGLGLASTAYAEMCAYDAVPAATLLFPFVIYDYENEDAGQTTLFAITNVSDFAQIVHITVWTDFSVAILDFNLTLTGYDVQTINIRDILRDGILPNETNGANIWETNNWGGASAPVPFDDGPYSTFNELWSGALDGYFGAPTNAGLPVAEGTSDGSMGAGATPLDCDPAVWDASPNNYATFGNIPQGTLDLFEGYLKRSQLATKGYLDCAAAGITFDNPPWFITRNSGPVWLYVTADAVGACNKELPDGATDYFNTGVTTGLEYNNVLIGDVIYLDPGNNYSEAVNAVHLEAEPGLGPGIAIAESTEGKSSSFYYRYHDGAGATFQDGREPLPTAWAFRYMVAEAASADTWVRAWKGSTLNAIVPDLTLVGAVAESPSEMYADSCIPYTYYAWDEDEGVNASEGTTPPPWSEAVPGAEPIPVPNLLPLETQEVNASEFFLVRQQDGSAFGWMLFIWPRSNWDGANPVVSDYYQTWMGVKYAAFGTYTAGLEGAVIGNFNCDDTHVLPQLGINRYVMMPPPMR